jgi:hypothetical protein
MGLRPFRVLFEQIAQRPRQKCLDYIEFGLRDRQTGKVVHDREGKQLARRGSNGFAIDCSHAAVIAPGSLAVLARGWSVNFKGVPSLPVRFV